MVRIPATPVGLGVALVLGALVAIAALRWNAPALAIVLLPLCTALGGFVAARWALRQAPVPGFAIGLFFVAVQLGCGLGIRRDLFAFVTIDVALIEVIAAITGGMLGSLLKRRAESDAREPDPEYSITG